MMFTATKSARLQHASYWSYEGNHPDGQDCRRNNPYGIPIGIIAWIAQDGSFKTRYSNESSFGCEVHVAATKEQWSQAWIDFAKHLGNRLRSDFGSLTVRKEQDGTHWLISRHDEIACEVFEISDNEPLLDQVKQGYAIFDREFMFYSDSLNY